MATFNADERKTLHEPLEILIGGNTYKIDKITISMSDEIVKLSNALEAKEINERQAATRQLAFFLKEDIKVVEEFDINSIAAALAYITSQTTNVQGQGSELKNSEKVEV